VGIYRGAGRPEAAMLLERLVDEAARLLKVDPFELRLKNVLAADQLPRRSATGELIDSGNFPDLLEKARDEAGYSGMRRAQKQRRRKGAIVGVGSAIYIEPCGIGGESASVEIGGDGRITATTGSSAQGQGRQTAFAQIVADVFCIDPSRVSVLYGDTRTVPCGVGALASRSTAIGGSALYVAAANLREMAWSRAASLMNCSADQIILTPTGFENVMSGKIVELRELAMSSNDRTAPFEGALKVDIDYTAEGEAWSSGCCVAGVSIEIDTGEIKVEKIVWIDDAGSVVNPMLVRGQLWGGLVQGLGEALHEQLIYDPAGQLLTGSLMDYAIPRAHDVPPVDFHELENPSLFNALGAKGVGEAGCIGVPAAVVNAVVDALNPFGVTHLDMPLTSEKIWNAIQRTTPRTNED
jgi:carbon-monoxide dehydrogenase large subunit